MRKSRVKKRVCLDRPTFLAMAIGSCLAGAVETDDRVKAQTTQKVSGALSFVRLQEFATRKFQCIIPC